MHAVETMAYRMDAGVPWHGLGNPVNNNMDVDSMLKAAGIDWTVSRRYVRMKQSSTNDELLPIPGYFAIVRDTDHKVYQIATDRYKPVQNRVIMEQFREHIAEGGMELDTAGSLKEGAVIWAMASLKKGFTLPGGDIVTGNLLYSTSHDGSLVTEAKFVSTRVVCWNTLSAAKGEKGKAFRLKHSAKFDKQKQQEAKEFLGLAIKRLERLEEWASTLAEVKIGKKEVTTLVAALTNPAYRERVIESTTDYQEFRRMGMMDDVFGSILTKGGYPEPTDAELNRVAKHILDSVVESPGSTMKSAKGTLWGIVNGVTYYTDHVAGRNADNRLTSAWFGQRENLKEDAFALALAVAKAA